MIILLKLPHSLRVHLAEGKNGVVPHLHSFLRKSGLLLVWPLHGFVESGQILGAEVRSETVFGHLNRLCRGPTAALAAAATAAPAG